MLWVWFCRSFFRGGLYFKQWECQSANNQLELKGFHRCYTHTHNLRVGSHAPPCSGRGRPLLLIIMQNIEDPASIVPEEEVCCKQLWGRGYRSLIMGPPFSLWLNPPLQLLMRSQHLEEGGAVWGRSLAVRNKPHCSSRSHAFLPLIFLLQPLAFFCLHCSFPYNVRAFPAFLSAGQICTVRTHPLREHWSI